MEIQQIVKITVQRKQKISSLTSLVNRRLASEKGPQQLQNPVLLAFLAQPLTLYLKLRQLSRKQNK